jgi:hypothetical protein
LEEHSNGLIEVFLEVLSKTSHTNGQYTIVIESSYFIYRLSLPVATPLRVEAVS